MSTAVVLGGGVSGLAAVYYLQRQVTSKFAKIILLEGSDRLGGWVHSTRYEDGAIFEHGPRSLRPVGLSGINSLSLAEDLGLTNDILPCLSSSAAAKNRFLYIKGQIHTLPNSFASIVRTQSPFSRPILMSALKEMFTAGADNTGETVHSFIARRFGKELADYAVDPMCRGIFAGDCRQLSVDACFPILTDMETKHGSVIRGMLLPKKKVARSSELTKKAKSERWVSWSLRRGMQQLTDRLTEAISQDSRTEVRTSSPCTSLSKTSDGKIRVKTDGEEVKADHIFSAVFAQNLGSLMEDAPLKKRLMQIPAVSVAVINLEYEGLQLPQEGFGHLLPSSESGPVLGVVYDSCAFPQHNRSDLSASTRLTVMMGGAWFDELEKLTALNTAQIEQLAVDSVRQHLDITVSPSRSYVAVHKNCIPQYLVGHNENFKSLEKHIANMKLPLSLIGSSYQGPSVNDCIYNARLTVEKMCQ